MYKMIKIGLCIFIGLQIQSCDPSKFTGYDCRFKFNNTTQDTIYAGFEMNYNRAFKKQVRGHLTLLPNSNIGQCGYGGGWDSMFKSELDSMHIYFIDKNTFKTTTWDSIFTQNKYLVVKTLSQSQFINSGKTISYP
jgi:hypothetical protein